MTIKEAICDITRQLSPVVGEAEAKAMAQMMLEDLKGCSQLDLVLNGHRELLPETESRIQAIVSRVLRGEPLQYVLGKASFHGRTFKVTPATLIPRPETSQLIDIIVKQWQSRSDLRVLDIGTGSGCIAISLALDLPFSQVTAIDISSEALAVARENAQALKARGVKFVQEDILKASPHGEYDIIVSNSPYVMEKERASMEKNVLDYEPASALFVPDDNPLLFYKAIADYASKALAPDGKLYFEINPLCASELATWLKANGWNAEIIRDYKGHNRFAICAR